MVGTFARLIGASGTRKILAVPPGKEVSDSSYEFTAVTVATIVAPQARLYGATLKTVNGTLQLRSDTTLLS
jgi:hypothetical protein